MPEMLPPLGLANDWQYPLLPPFPPSLLMGLMGESNASPLFQSVFLPDGFVFYMTVDRWLVHNPGRRYWRLGPGGGLGIRSVLKAEPSGYGQDGFQRYIKGDS